jgi:RNA polymerase sigma-70 factor, ECF subfamily
MTNIELELKRIASGDRAAFARLWRTTQPECIRYATGLLAGDRSAAEDAVDEAFIAIWQQSGRYDGRGNAMGWVRRIVRNKAIDWLRKQRDIPMSGEPQMEDRQQDEGAVPTPFDCAERTSTAAKLRAALATLSVEQREAVWLCYYEEKSLREIAEHMACPENTVKTRLFHARKALRNSGLVDSLS